MPETDNPYDLEPIAPKGTVLTRNMTDRPELVLTAEQHKKIAN